MHCHLTDHWISPTQSRQIARTPLDGCNLPLCRRHTLKKLGPETCTKNLTQVHHSFLHQNNSQTNHAARFVSHARQSLWWNRAVFYSVPEKTDWPTHVWCCFLPNYFVCKLLSLRLLCTFRNSFPHSHTRLIRPPGTLVPKAFCFSRDVFLKFAIGSQSSVGRSTWNFATWAASASIL